MKKGEDGPTRMNEKVYLLGEGFIGSTRLHGNLQGRQWTRTGFSCREPERTIEKVLTLKYILEVLPGVLGKVEKVLQVPNPRQNRVYFASNMYFEILAYLFSPFQRLFERLSGVDDGDESDGSRRARQRDVCCDDDDVVVV